MVLCCSSFPNCNRICQAHATLRRKVTMLRKRVDHCRRKDSQKLSAHSSITHPRFSCGKHTLTGILICTCEPTAYLWHTARALFQTQRFFFRGSASWCVTEHPLTTAAHLFARVTMEIKGSAILTDDTVGLKLLWRTACYFFVFTAALNTKARLWSDNID